MNGFQRAMRATLGNVKAFRAMVWGRTSYGWGQFSSIFLPRTRFDYAREVGDGTGSALVMAPVLWIARAFPEAPVRVRRHKADDTFEVIHDHPLVLLLERPNPYMSGANLWMATLIDYTVTGNAYWIKVRSGAGRVVQLWWVPDCLMAPVGAEDGTIFITHYEYRPDPGRAPIRLDPADVVHFRFGADPANPRKGMAPLTSVLREIFTDDEAANFSAALVRNVGVPGVIVAPKDSKDRPVDMSPEEAEETKALFMAKFGGDRRGEPLILRTPADVSVLSFNPQQMDLRNLRFTTEERVCAILGISPGVVGFGSGLSRNTFSNYAEAREAAWENNIIPTQRLLMAELNAQLLPDFGATAGVGAFFDLGDVRVLQTDENALAERAGNLLVRGVITRAQALELIGEESQPADQVYYLPTTVKVVPREYVTPEPQAAPDPTAAPALPANVTPIRVAGLLGPLDTKALDTKALDPDTAYLAALDLAAATLTDEFAGELAALFGELGRACAAQLPSPSLVLAGAHHGEQKAIYDTAISILTAPVEAAIRALVALYRKWFGKGAEVAFKAAGDRLGVPVPFAPDDRDVDLLIYQGAQRHALVDLSGQTEAAVRAALVAGRAAGDTPAQLAGRIEHLVSGAQLYPGIAAEAGPQAAARFRAQTIATTEIAHATNTASAIAFQKGGVAEVRVSDGDGCGWAHHDSPDRADGSVRTVAEYLAHPLAHPRCVRRATPIVREQ